MIKITLKDGSTKEVESGLAISEIASGISVGLARAAVAAKVDGKVVSLTDKIEEDCALEILTFADEEGREVYRHTCSHVLAQAVKSVYPTCKLAIGPAIANGFYYDFDFKSPISQADLDKIEAEMKKIIKADFPLERFELPREEAVKLMQKYKETYKVELIRELPEGEVISFYKQGTFVDLCRGPHLASTGRIKAFKLTQIAGAYWRGNEKNKMLTRIYGTAFDKSSELTEYLARVEEAKKRDHNKLGRELGIFMTEENIGQGLPLLMPKGAKMIQVLQRFVEDEEERRGYLRTKTPEMAKNNLYKISGHWDHYRDGMFVLGEEGKDEEVLALRPMTCPFQFMIYKNGLKSYRDLPVRYAETATLFRKENSGEMHGLIRIREFTLSDGHVVCTPEQLESEFTACVDMIKYFMTALGFEKDVTYRFSKWDPNNREKYIGDAKDWEHSQSVMKQILDHIGLDYKEADGEAAFYGPKLDVQFTNVYGKEDTLFTIQIDFALASKFEMTYVDENGDKKVPFIIHRSSIGCYERTLAMLIEKYAGAFPVWMSPTQVTVMSLTDRTVEKTKEIADTLRRAGIRCELDNRSEKIGYKIREAQLAKVPYMLVVGDRDVEAGVVSVRARKAGDLGQMTLEDFISRISREVEEKVLD